MTNKFDKMHGQGNDFIILDRRGVDAPPVSRDAARALADRRFGIGCDQILVIGDSDSADIRMDVLNQDGSPSNACGNGTRCVGDLVMRQSDAERLTVQTGAGILRLWWDAGGVAGVEGSNGARSAGANGTASADENGTGSAGARGEGVIAVDMGPVDTSWRGVPLLEERDTLSVDLGIDGIAHAVCHSLGNPHAVVFVDDAERIDLADIGPRVEGLPLFPERVNFSVASRIREGRFRMRVWERGAGITSACGSGACAVGAAICRRGLGPARNGIVMDGGEVQVEWDPDGGHAVLSGPVTHVFAGELAPAFGRLVGAAS